MSQTRQERNKALVLEAFDTLFNKRDYKASTLQQRCVTGPVNEGGHVEAALKGAWRLTESAVTRREPYWMSSAGTQRSFVMRHRHANPSRSIH